MRTKHRPPPSAIDPSAIRFAVLAVDIAVMTILDSRLHVLLIPVHLPPEIVDARGLPGGLVQPRETAEDAVLRLLSEKGSLKEYYSEQLATFSGVGRDPRGRVVSVAYLALLPQSAARVRALPEGAAWCDVRRVGKLAYDHNDILEAAHERLLSKLASTTIVRTLLAPRFTLSELQATYETVLSRRLDKRNFRRKLLASGIIRATGKKVQPAIGRPGELYRFTGSGLQTIGILSGT